MIHMRGGGGGLSWVLWRCSVTWKYSNNKRWYLPRRCTEQFIYLLYLFTPTRYLWYPPTSTMISLMPKTADDVTISGEKLALIFPRLEAKNKGNGKRKMKLCFSKKVTFLKTELHLCFSLFLSVSLLEPLIQHNLETNFLFVTSQAVLDHLGYWTFPTVLKMSPAYGTHDIL